MTSLRFALLAPLGVALALATSAARADDPPGTLPQPTPPGTPGTTTVVAPPASGGLTVVAPTPGGGQVTASGCTTVVVQGAPTLVGPGGGPCPTYAPYQPYQPGYYPQAAPMYEMRPKYAKDSERKAAVLASALFFGIGGGVAGIAYLIQHSESTQGCGRTRYAASSSSYSDERCNPGGARVSLITYGAIITLVPSVGRFVVGDNTKGLIYTGLRGVSFASAALIDWGGNGDTKWQGPFLLGFAVPITLGIIDLATTPHREDLEEAAAQPPKTGVTDVAPVAMTDRNGRTHGAVLSVSGLF